MKKIVLLLSLLCAGCVSYTPKYLQVDPIEVKCYGDTCCRDLNERRKICVASNDMFRSTVVYFKIIEK